jgi:membrane protein YdbS with pleckstrin-like domain
MTTIEKAFMTDDDKKYHEELVRLKIRKLQEQARKAFVREILSYLLIGAFVICIIALASWVIIFHEKVAIVMCGIACVVGFLAVLSVLVKPENNTGDE